MTAGSFSPQVSRLCFVILIHSDRDVVLCAAQWAFCFQVTIISKVGEGFESLHGQASAVKTVYFMDYIVEATIVNS